MNYGKAVLDANRVQHIAAAEFGRTLCGVEWFAYDLHWAETTRIHCTDCFRVLEQQP